MAKLICISVGMFLISLISTAAVQGLPDQRAYEMVTPVEKNGWTPGVGVSAPDGNAVDWEANGGLGDASYGAENLYRSARTSTGWQTKALTPAPLRPLGLLEEQIPVFWTADLSQTIFTTPASYDPADNDDGALDLYLESPNGTLTWISQGSQGGSEPKEVTFDAATPDASHVVFSTEESLVPQATGLEPGGGARRAQDYLYVRNVPAGETQLVNVNNEGKLISAEGALLGSGGELATGSNSYAPADLDGTTTNAISSDGSKIFFESPPPSSLGTPPVHLYMRENNSLTVPIDDPASSGAARYAGASEDGSLVFFTSTEGLGGDPSTDTELYDFNTVTQSVTALSAGSSDNVEGQVVGVTAIANDGSHVYFVAKGLLSSNLDAVGQPAEEGEPNFYVYDTETGTTTFIATLAEVDVSSLTSEPDVERSAEPTPDGTVLVFDSRADLTDQNSSGFAEVYRYDAQNGSLLCISCAPPGVTPSQSATIVGSSGGSYAPAGEPTTMSADGSRIFFDSPDPLVPEDVNTDTPATPVGGYDVYEWENGQIFLISGGRTETPSLLDGTTPSGNDVFFTTNEELVPQDTDGGYFNIYDARVDGGFPPPPEPTNSCEGAGCRGPIAPAPIFGAPGSALLQGAPPSVASSALASPKPKPKSKPKSKHRLKPKSKSKSKRRLKSKPMPRRLKGRLEVGTHDLKRSARYPLGGRGRARRDPGTFA